MGHTSYKDKWAVCPYYRTQGRLFIRCEGVGGSDWTTLSFRTAEALGKYTMRYCNSIRGCKDCIISWCQDEDKEERPE
ncbi:MAG: hypothetical protein IKS52_04600 [Clostridia bacterium]|nr:hypothetical protein [Clostridia bacterium]